MPVARPRPAIRSEVDAQDDGLSASAVNTCVQRIQSKLGVRAAVEIVRHARGNGLLG